MQKIRKIITTFLNLVNAHRIIALCAINLNFNTSDTDELVVKGDIHFDDREYDKAVKCYDEALSKSESDANVWKKKGFVLFNIGIDNESVNIKRYEEPPYNQAKNLISYYNLSYHSTSRSRTYLERSHHSFERAVQHNPEDLELWLYKGIVCLYLSPSSSCDPINDFDNVLKLIDNQNQTFHPLNFINDMAWYGKSISYLKIWRMKDRAEECSKNIKKHKPSR